MAGGLNLRHPAVYISGSMRFKPLSVAAGVAGLVAVAIAQPQKLSSQETTVGRCAMPDTVVVIGAMRNTEEQIIASAGLLPGAPLNARIVQLSIKSLFATGQFDDVAVFCEAPDNGPTKIVVRVRERPILEGVTVTGVERLNEGSVRSKLSLPVSRPLDPAELARAIARVDSMYSKAGFYLARVTPESTLTPSGGIRIAFRVNEGRRLAVSGVRIEGNSRVSDEDIVSAMKTKPEGFWWFRAGEFNDDNFAGDLAERIPSLYSSRGMIDFEILRDTLIVDRELGKALVEIQVREGPQYAIGNFDVEGNTRFSSEDIARFYPFDEENVSLRDRVTGLVRRVGGAQKNLFDQERWNEATDRLKTAYSNEGYIYAQVRPILDRRVGPDSVPIVDLRWQIDERQPAIVNRVEIVGNDYTQEQCIRDQLVLIPGDVFNQDRLIRSYQNIANMGFFNTPLPPPDTRTANDEGDVDLIFKVTEKRTGNIQFGASVGAQVGVGGFIGLDQPNLFGMCKRGSLQWQFGSTINDFTLSYTDPNIRRSLVSGTATAYHSMNRFLIANVGRSIRTGGSLQLGFPVPRSRYTRAFVSYGGERVQFGQGGFLQNQFSSCDNCFRSTLGLSAQHDTRIDLPFATAGGMQTASLNFNGGPLGGTAKFTQFRTELKGYAPLAQFGSGRPGSSAIKIAAGLTARAGAVFGDPGPFIYSQGFALGGVQFGEQLRGYPEFSVTPDGFVPTGGGYTANISSFGRAFFTTTAEVGVRFNQMIYLSSFIDAGNVWRRASDFDPTRLFRGAGFGASVVTPLGPLGLDYAYGFDRKDAFGQPNPRWQFHFRLGQLF
jgi:outer membrane protein insertion porin family